MHEIHIHMNSVGEWSKKSGKSFKLYTKVFVANNIKAVG